jgi:hypothetical protein
MQKILSFLFFCSSLFASPEVKDIFSSYDTNEFSIHQDPSMRIFYVKASGKVLGIVLSSEQGRFDFYDGEKKKRWSNLYDSLFDDSGNRIGKLVWEKDPEAEKWFWMRERFFYKPMSYINVYTGDKKELLVTFHPYCEGNENLFVFSDGQTKQPLAIAYWFWTKGEWFSPQVQNWQIYIIDRPCLQDRNISEAFLTWVLLKHSQVHFTFGSSQYDYIAELPPN